MLKATNGELHILKVRVPMRLDKWANIFLLSVFFWMAAAASFSGFIAKWGLQDNGGMNNISRILDGTAERPYVYRQLVPSIANFADKNLPNGFKSALIGQHDIDKIYVKASGFAKPDLRFRYLIVYYATFLALFASMFILRAIVLENGASQAVALLAPIALALALPYFETNGGYFYDNVEIFFLGLSFLFALRGRVFLLFLVIIPATLNKETFFFFLPTLYPLLRAHRTPVMSILILGITVCMSGAANVVVKYVYAANRGLPAIFQLWENLRGYAMPWFYRRTEITYGLIGPAKMSFITVAVVALLFWHGWRTCSSIIRQHMVLAGMISLPLFLTFASIGELRNLSLLFVGMTIIIAKAMEYAGAPREATSLPASERYRNSSK
jgi:hypothetical protein